MIRLHKKKIDDAKYYEKIWGEEFNARPYYDAVRQRALAAPYKPGMSVLDVGGGVFGTAQFIVDTIDPEANVTIADQSHTAAEILKDTFPSINFVITDVTSLPFKNGLFDLVIAGEIIEHMEDPAAFVKELKRVTKKTGSITLSTVDTTCENAILHGDYPEHLWSFTEEDLLEFFGKGAKFSLVGDYQFIQWSRS